MSHCVFCDIVAGSASADVCYQDEEIIVFTDIKPVSKFHLLSVSKEHIPSINVLTSEHAELIERLKTKGRQALISKGGNVNDVRMGFHVPPFYTVAHLHMHVISPVSDMSCHNRIVFMPNTWWFASVDKILKKLESTSTP